MSGSDLRSLCEQLAGEVAEELRCGRSKKWRCPADLRTRIVSYARVCRERGEPQGDIAARLGLVESTLARWLRAERKALALAPGFRAVSVVEAEEQVHGERGGALRLTTPAGYVVEGLDAPTLAFLLRVVG